MYVCRQCMYSVFVCIYVCMYVMPSRQITRHILYHLNTDVIIGNV